MSTTHTCVNLAVSQATFEEVKGKLLAAGYQHAVEQRGDRQLLDMRGIKMATTKSNPATHILETVVCRAIEGRQWRRKSDSRVFTVMDGRFGCTMTSKQYGAYHGPEAWAGSVEALQREFEPA